MNYFEQWHDLGVWVMLQYYYFPHYIVGKQDEWKGWVNTTLNGWKPSNFSICRSV